jgi:hypothetical protein
MRSTGAVLCSMRRFFYIYNSNCVYEIEFENAFNLYAKLEQAISYICFLYKTASRPGTHLQKYKQIAIFLRHPKRPRSITI